MTRARRILDAARSNPASLSFSDIQRLAEAADFVLARVSGSHHVYKRAGIPEIIDIQPRGRQAKPYQVRQVVYLIDKYQIEIV